MDLPPLPGPRRRSSPSGRPPARAAFLTGAVVYSTDAAGAPSSGEYWNTVGGDNRYNLYVAIGPQDPILNPANGASTSLNLPLPVGTYTYDIYGDGSTVFDHYGLALFFNGSTTPFIAAFTATGEGSTVEVPKLDGSVGLDTSSAASPAALTFIDTTTIVTLGNFTWNAPTTGGLDRVSGLRQHARRHARLRRVVHADRHAQPLAARHRARARLAGPARPRAGRRPSASTRRRKARASA